MTQIDHGAAAPLPFPRASLEAIIQRHGAVRVLVATVVAMLRPRGARPLAATLSELDNHMRRDIGLTPKAASPPMPHWTHFGW